MVDIVKVEKRVSTITAVCGMYSNEIRARERLRCRSHDEFEPAR